MNLFIVAFLYLGTAIGIIKVTLSAASSIAKGLVQNILGSHSSDSKTFLGSGDDSKAKPSEAPKINPDEAATSQPGALAPLEQGNGNMEDMFNATSIRMARSMDGNIDPSALGAASSGGTNIGASAVVGLVNVVPFLNQSGNVSNFGRQIVGPMLQLGGNILNDNIKGKKRFTIAQTGGTIMNKIDKPKKPTFNMRGPSQTLINNGKNIRLNTIGGIHQINGKKISLRKPTNSRFLFEQGVKRFYTKKVYLGNGERNDVQALSLNNRTGRKIDINSVLPKILNDRRFSGANTSFGEGLSMEEYAKLIRFTEELMKNEKLKELTSHEASIEGMVGESNDMIQMYNDPEFRKMLRTMIEANPNIDPNSLASMIMMAQQMLKKRRPVGTLAALNSRNTDGNNGNGQDMAADSVKTYTLEDNSSDLNTDATKSTEEYENMARNNVSEHRNIVVEKLKGAAVMLTLGNKQILNKNEQKAIKERVKEVKASNNLTKEQEENLEKELTNGAINAKLTVAGEQMQEAIKSNENGVKGILGDDLFDQVMKKLESLEKEKRKRDKRTDVINNQISTSMQTSNVNSENTNSTEGDTSNEEIDVVGNYLKTADINSILAELRKKDESGGVNESYKV